MYDNVLIYFEDGWMYIWHDPPSVYKHPPTPPPHSKTPASDLVPVNAQ